MNNSGSTAAELQEKIAAARREAETLKEKIRAKRDQLADTSCKFNLFILLIHTLSYVML